jgi:hypothetical protein
MSSSWLPGALVAALVGCGGEGEPQAELTPAQGGSGGSGGAPVVEPSVYVSIVAEEGPGSGPALLRMVNDTPGQILSLTLPTGEAFAFYLVEPGTSSDYAPIASANMLDDAILSLHTLDTCIRKPFAELNGPLSLEPGRAYSLHVSGNVGFIGDIVEDEAPAPFLGIRVLIDDRSLPTQVGAASLLTLSSEATDSLQFEDVFDELPAPFHKIDAPSLSLDEIRFRDLAGVEHVAPGPIELSGAFGFTVYVAPEPTEGGAIVPLVP